MAGLLPIEDDGRRRVKLPCEGRRGGHTFIKLIHKVAPDAWSGFGMEGKILRQGAVIDEAELWPGPDWPTDPLLIEDCGIVIPGRKGNPSWIQFILWQYDQLKGEFREVARDTSQRGMWATTLGQVAKRAIESRTPLRIVDLEQESNRIADLVGEALDKLDERERRRLLAILHDELAWRMSEVWWPRVAKAG